MPPGIADSAVWQFADSLIWNWLIAGTDAHAKNHSVLLADNQIRLAPMYDVASALPNGTHEKKLHFAMKIGGDYGVYPQRNTWPAAARDLGLDPDHLVTRVRELAFVITDAFAEAAAKSDVRMLDRQMPGKLVDLIADRASRCLSMVALTDAES